MKVYLVGAGPGDPGLLTLRGRELLERADVVIYDALANPALLQYARPDAELAYVGKIADQHAMPQEDINRLLAQKAHENKRVVRLKGGDPYIFGRGAEEAEYLWQQGIPFEEVPGITSAIAAPAYAGIPLTHRDLVSSVSIITGHEKPGKPDSALNWQALAASGSTLVFVMGVRNLAHISHSLIQAGMQADTPAALVYRGTTFAQRCLYSTLANIADEASNAGFANPAVFVVGKVVGLAGHLDWFMRKPLFGKRIVVTRARAQASELGNQLAQLGAEVVECPAIEIAPLDDYAQLDQAIGQLDKYRWIVFTSVNGVTRFWERLSRLGRDARALCNCRLAAIGPATGGALLAKGLRADLVPPTYVAESVAQALLNAEDIAGAKILLPRACEAREALPAMLEAHGAKVDVVPVYRTIKGSGNANVLVMLENGELDCVTFGSSSSVRNFLSQIPAERIKAHPEVVLAAIGPITAQTLQDAGLEARIVPHAYTIPALVQAIADFFQDNAKPCP